jgi:hypothetical protein
MSGGISLCEETQNTFSHSVNGQRDQQKRQSRAPHGGNRSPDLESVRNSQKSGLRIDLGSRRLDFVTLCFPSYPTPQPSQENPSPPISTNHTTPIPHQKMCRSPLFRGVFGSSKVSRKCGAVRLQMAHPFREVSISHGGVSQTASLDHPMRTSESHHTAPPHHFQPTPGSMSRKRTWKLLFVPCRDRHLEQPSHVSESSTTSSMCQKWRGKVPWDSTHH